MEKLKFIDRPRSFISQPVEKAERIPVCLVPDPKINFFGKQDIYKNQLKVTQIITSYT
jgi:hypothetical protein